MNCQALVFVILICLSFFRCTGTVTLTFHLTDLDMIQSTDLFHILICLTCHLSIILIFRLRPGQTFFHLTEDQTKQPQALSWTTWTRATVIFLHPFLPVRCRLRLLSELRLFSFLKLKFVENEIQEWLLVPKLWYCKRSFKNPFWRTKKIVDLLKFFFVFSALVITSCSV